MKNSTIDFNTSYEQALKNVDLVTENNDKLNFLEVSNEVIAFVIFLILLFLLLKNLNKEEPKQ